MSPVFSAFSLYANQTYLESLGYPKTLNGFKGADFIGIGDNKAIIALLKQRGLISTSAKFPLVTAHHIAYWELVKQGAGIGFMTDDVALLEKGMMKVVPELGSFSTEFWLVTHRELRTNRRIRRVFDFLYSQLNKRKP